MNCPPLADLLHHAVEGSLPQEWRPHVERDCPQCQRRWRLVLRLPQVSRLLQEEPPERLRRMAMSLAEGAGPLERLRAWVGRLMDPPRLTPALRGTSSAQMLRYQAGDLYELDLTHLESSDLVGQLLAIESGTAPATGSVVLQQDERSWTTDLDEFGEFQFEEVSPGRYDLWFAFDDERILIEDIDLE